MYIHVGYQVISVVLAVGLQVIAAVDAGVVQVRFVLDACAAAAVVVFAVGVIEQELFAVGRMRHMLKKKSMKSDVSTNWNFSELEEFVAAVGSVVVVVHVVAEKRRGRCVCVGVNIHET